MAKKPKSYDIKVPVFTTEIFEKPKDMFGGISYEHMNSFIEKKIEQFSQNSNQLTYENRNKTKKTVINDIKTHYCETDAKAVLLQVTAYSTNHYDGYLEAEEKIPFKKNHKIGSETNFIMLYPIITGIDSNNYSHHFLVLVYEDPTKSDDEILKLTKQLLNKVLTIPIANIKLPTVLDELRKYGTIPELQMRYSAINYDEQGVDASYLEFLTDGNLSKIKVHKFKDMPFDKIEQIIESPNDDDFQKKVAKLTIGKKEYKITKEMINEAKDELKLSVEKVFNMRTTITHEEMDNIHEINFIFSKLFPILENYSTNGENV